MAAPARPARAEPADTFELLSRLGFAARGLVYILLGVFALYGGQADSSSGVLEFLSQQAFGRILVAIVGVGLLGYGLWRLVGAWYDLEDEKTVERLAHAGAGLAYLGLALLAFALALGLAGGGAGGGGAQQATGTALGFPGGRYLVMAAGAGFVVAGLFQVVRGLRDRHMQDVTAPEAPRTALRWLGKAGIVARGIVFAIIGWFIVQAGLAANPQAARSPGEALDTLVGWPALALSAGLLLFGVFSLMLAVYRRIDDRAVRARINAAFS